MYVIAEIQGQQFKVEEGKKLYVHHMQNVETGATVEIEKVLLADNDVHNRRNFLNALNPF